MKKKKCHRNLDKSALWKEPTIQMSRVQVPDGHAWIRPGRLSLTVRNSCILQISLLHTLGVCRGRREGQLTLARRAINAVFPKGAQ
jgi:hypothetical protein